MPLLMSPVRGDEAGVTDEWCIKRAETILKVQINLAACWSVWYDACVTFQWENE